MKTNMYLHTIVSNGSMMEITHMEIMFGENGITIRIAPGRGNWNHRPPRHYPPPPPPYEYSYQQEPGENRNYPQKWGFFRSDQNQQRPIE